MTSDRLLAQLTIEEKVGLLSGGGRWVNNGVDRLGIRPLKMVDGPNGARGDSRHAVPAVVIPAPVSLGASWDIALVERLGDLLGCETRRRKAQILLAPTINLQRTPIGGRNFECYSEDPELTAQLAVAYVRGVQAQGVAATGKHFVGNDTEVDRHGIDCRIDERTLREVYLRPFEAVVAEADVLAVMAAYNRVNGSHCTENRRLLRSVLRDEWGFGGLVVSDWHAVVSTSATVSAGTTVEMPGPPAHYGQALVDEVVAGNVDEALVDGLVREVLHVVDKVRWPDGSDDIEESVDDPDDRALCREAAAAGTVLLSNNGLLPIDVGALARVAVIGPLADRAQIQGGGSAKLVPLPTLTPRQAIERQLGESIDVLFAKGADIDKRAPVIGEGLTRRDGERGVDIVYFSGRDCLGTEVGSDTRPTSEITWQAGVPSESDADAWSLRATGRYTASVGGVHRFSLITTGAAALYSDGVELVGELSEHDPRGDAYYSLAGEEVFGELNLAAGESTELQVEYSTGSHPYPAVRVGCRPPQAGDLLPGAVAAAAEADVAIVVVGTTDEWETEGNDRDALSLPANQDALIAAVAEVNPNTVVVLTVGAPVTMPWLDDVAAVLVPWFGGIEGAHALVDVLVGSVEPGGRLPITFPKQLDHHPAADHYPGSDRTMTYGEGVLVGHRGYAAAGTEVLFPFGHGLSYTEFSFGELTIDGDCAGSDLVASVAVANVGDRQGSTVVQVYAKRGDQPAPVLAGFARVQLQAGAENVVEVPIRARTLAEWGDAGWQAPTGPTVFMAGTSSHNLCASQVVDLR